MNTFKPQAATIVAHKSIHHKSHIDQFTAVLLQSGDDKKFERLLCATVHFLPIDRRGLKHASVDVL